MPATTRRKTAANLAKEMMPGPRLPTVRPTKPRFTFRKPVPTVAPRNMRLHTVRVRKTAANLAKRIQKLASRIQEIEDLEARYIAEIEKAKVAFRSVNTNFRNSRIRTQRKQQLVSSVRHYKDMLGKVRDTLKKVRNEKDQINTYKVPSLTVRSVNAPNKYTKEKMEHPPNLPGTVEEQNNNNK